MATAPENLPGSERAACWERDERRNSGSPSRSQGMSSGSEAGVPSERDAAMGGGSARSTGEAGQCPRREGAEQGGVSGEGHMAAPEADEAVSTKLVGLVARGQAHQRHSV